MDSRNRNGQTEHQITGGGYDDTRAKRISQHARDGNVEAIEYELAHGVARHSLSLTYAPLPLLFTKPGPATEALLQKWLHEAGDSPTRRFDALASISQHDVLHALVRLSARDYDYPGRNRTFLGEALAAGRTEAAQVILTVLAERNQAPNVAQHRTIFDWALSSDVSIAAITADRAIATVLGKIYASGQSVPGAFRLSAGTAMLESSVEYRAIEPVATFLRRTILATYASVPRNGFSDRWVRVLEHGITRSLADWLIDPANNEIARAVLDNLAEEGFDFGSSIRFRRFVHSPAMPLLHAAVKMKNASIVRALIAHGADPRRPAVVNHAVVTPIALARNIGADECFGLLTQAARLGPASVAESDRPSDAAATRRSQRPR